mmetsp:Transcript_10783/g.27731  ORF Transcript_10783/g.27731 Transcript_10783/m.27731 type:complete len:388 (+) Transcript_10783:612-1775(+)
MLLGIESQGFRIEDGGLLVLGSLEGLVSLLLLEVDTRSVATLDGLLRLLLRCTRLVRLLPQHRLHLLAFSQREALAERGAEHAVDDLIELPLLHARALLELAHLALGRRELVAQPDHQLRRQLCCRRRQPTRDELIDVLREFHSRPLSLQRVEIDGGCERGGIVESYLDFSGARRHDPIEEVRAAVRHVQSRALVHLHSLRLDAGVHRAAVAEVDLKGLGEEARVDVEGGGFAMLKLHLDRHQLSRQRQLAVRASRHDEHGQLRHALIRSGDRALDVLETLDLEGFGAARAVELAGETRLGLLQQLLLGRWLRLGDAIQQHWFDVRRCIGDKQPVPHSRNSLVQRKHKGGGAAVFLDHPQRLVRHDDRSKLLCWQRRGAGTVKSQAD